MKKILFIATILLIWFHADNLQAQDYFGINPVTRLYSNWGREYSGTSSGDTLFFVVQEELRAPLILHLVDCRDAENIHEIGCFPLEITNYVCMKARSNILFIAHGEGFGILRIDQNLRIQRLAHFNFDQGCTAVELMEDYAFVGGGDGRMTIMNITDPSNPEISATLDLGYIPTQIKISGSTAYVTGDRFTIINLENPENPEVISTTNLSGLDLEIINETACIAIGDDGIRFYDISDPADPSETGHIINSSYRLAQLDGYLLSGHQIIRERFDDGHDYVIYDVSNCWLIDVSNPFVPVPINRAMWCYGNLFTTVNDMIAQFYGNPGSWYLSFHSIHQNGRLVPAGRLDPPPQPTRFVTGDTDFLYIVNSENLVVSDISSPEQPQELSRLELGNVKLSRPQNGSIFFYNSADRIFRSINIENPRLPQFTDFSFEPPFDIRSYSLRTYMDNLIITTCRGEQSGIFIVSTDPDNPGETFFELDSLFENPPAIIDEYMYVPALGDGVIILDISDLMHPREVGRLNVGSDVWKLDAEVDLLCVYCGNDSIQVFNIENRDDPQFLSSFGTPHYPLSFQIKDSYLYFDSGWQLNIVDLSNPENPEIVGRGQTHYQVTSFFINPQYIYTSEGHSLGIYECSEVVGVNPDREDLTPQTTILYPAYPNPFNGFTSLKYHLTKPATVQIGIFDSQGRQVLDITNHQMKYPGIHTEIIDAKGLPSGSYYAFLKAGDLQEVAPLILVK
jgi:hypothetical protein